MTLATYKKIDGSSSSNIGEITIPRMNDLIRAVEALKPAESVAEPPTNLFAPVIQVPEQPAPVVNINVPEQPAAQVTVQSAVPEIRVEIPAPVVNIQMPGPADEVLLPSVAVSVELGNRQILIAILTVLTLLALGQLGLLVFLILM